MSNFKITGNLEVAGGGTLGGNEILALVSNTIKNDERCIKLNDGTQINIRKITFDSASWNDSIVYTYQNPFKSGDVPHIQITPISPNQSANYAIAFSIYSSINSNTQFGVSLYGGGNNRVNGYFFVAIGRWK